MLTHFDEPKLPYSNGVQAGLAICVSIRYDCAMRNERYAVINHAQGLGVPGWGCGATTATSGAFSRF